MFESLIPLGTPLLMIVCSSQSYVLEHFLRLDSGRPESWLSALQVMTTTPRLSRKILSTTPTREFRARLSFLASSDLRVSGTYTQNPSRISGTNAGAAAVIMPVAGTVNFEVANDHYLCGPWLPFVLDPDEDFHATLSEETHLLIVQLNSLTQSGYRQMLRHDQTELAGLLTTFLYETPFFRSHQHAQKRMERLSRQLYGLINEGASSASSPPKRKLIMDERRLCTAIQLMNNELASDITIESIASRSGLSLRSLHYLMKQYIGQSPYQYVRGRRLIKAREAIIRDYPDEISIAHQALNWGFQHAGRFANYYHQHFGEYPNQTLRELDHLEQFSSHIRSLADTTTANRHYWLTSSVSPKNLTDDNQNKIPQNC